MTAAARPPAPTDAELRALVDAFAALVLRWRVDGPRADALAGCAAGGAAALLLHGLPSARVAGRLRTLVAIDALLARLLGDADMIREWLRASGVPSAARAPLELMVSDAGLDLVARLLACDVEADGCAPWC